MRIKYMLFFLLLLFSTSACGTGFDADPCDLESIIIPTLPAVIPDEFELDETTNLHKSGDPQVIDLESYLLKITGLVDHPMSFTYDQLRCMPRITDIPTLNCPRTFIDKAQWSGVRLAYILKQTGIREGASTLYIISADGYSAKVNLEDALLPVNYLAYEWEGEPLPIMHGFPLRAVFPNLNGSHWVKWLVEIRVE